MTETQLIAILFIGELALVTTGLAVYLFLRYRRVTKALSNTKRLLATAMKRAKPATTIKFVDYLQQNIALTKQKLHKLPKEQADTLRTRLEYLQLEALVQQQAVNTQVYWEQLIIGLNNILPVIPPGEPTPNELDDVAIDSALDKIPILKDNVSDPVDINPARTIESANRDLDKLRTIITRQHYMVEELKKSLLEKDIDLTGNQDLSEKLEEIEVSEAQLNMCVETLEKENQRLYELFKDDEVSPQTKRLKAAR